MIAIIDYGVGNLFSLSHSFAHLGADCVVTGDPEEIARSERIILPGVGAFGDAVRKLRATNLDRVLLDQAALGKPLLGICLGMQLLFDRSFEFEVSQGLGLIPGEIRPIRDRVPSNAKVPHIGWNSLIFPEGDRHPIFSRIQNGECVYFVHSYYAQCESPYLIASTEYNALLTAAAARKNVCGVQFHPEKSGEVGLNILRAFLQWNPEQESSK